MRVFFMKMGEKKCSFGVQNNCPPITSKSNPGLSCSASGCDGVSCWKCVFGNVPQGGNIEGPSFTKRVVELIGNSPLLSCLCSSCASAGAHDDESTINAEETTVENSLAGLHTKMDTLTDAVLQLSGKVDEPLAKATADTTALVNFFGPDVRLYSSVLKKGIKENSAAKVIPPSFAPNLGRSSGGSSAEDEEAAAHKKSLVFFGLPEAAASGTGNSKGVDVPVVKELLQACGVDYEIKETFRMGRPDPNRSRPRLLKVVLSSSAEVVAVLRGKKNLKGVGKWDQVRIRRSLSKSDRALLSLCQARAGQLNSSKLDRNDDDNVTYFARVDEFRPRVVKKQGEKVLWNWRDSENF
ncbi:MAG: hypothetical protein GY820_05335 [Gammaproteobacteria bacterium]|nr:hypothetical protein [Gammaproteobacteria bacterium]